MKTMGFIDYLIIVAIITILALVIVPNIIVLARG